jgi:NADH-quinone oxidoreductase subunit C
MSVVTPQRNNQDLLEYLEHSKYPHYFKECSINSVDSTVVVILKEYSSITTFLESLKNDKKCGIEMMLSICAVDYPSREKRFELIYNMLSLTKNSRMLIKSHVQDNEIVPSVSHIFSVAEWYEREVWDMYGIIFSGNKDMRRVLTDYGFVGHPMRKDFPLTGYVEMHYDNNQAKVISTNVNLPQDFRTFDFSSPWEGKTCNVLYGDEKATNSTIFDKYGK